MKYKIQFDLICPESDDDGDILSLISYNKDSVYSPGYAPGDKEGSFI